jgi:hypothetical protein
VYWGGAQLAGGQASAPSSLAVDGMLIDQLHGLTFRYMSKSVPGRVSSHEKLTAPISSSLVSEIFCKPAPIESRTLSTYVGDMWEVRLTVGDGADSRTG